jgi:hypothetical protein
MEASIGGPKRCPDKMHSAGVTQLVECQLPKLDVAGSTPVTRLFDEILPSVVLKPATKTVENT